MASDDPTAIPLQDLPQPLRDSAPPMILSSRIRIAAPAAHVSRILSTPSTWPKWNTFVPSATVVPASQASTNPTPNPEEGGGEEAGARPLQLHDKMIEHAQLRPTDKPRDSPVRIVEKEQVKDERGRTVHRLCWELDQFPDWAMTAYRTNEITADEDGQGCEYRNWEVMEGVLARVTKWMYGKVLEERFLGWARELKGYAEETWKVEGV